MASCASAPARIGREAPLVGFEDWELPTQRLYRAEVRSSEGRSSFRLVLRMWRSDRFEIDATDPIGRPLWQLEIAGERGKVRDRRAGTVCVFAAMDSIELPSLEIPLPAAELPAVLAGRLPIPVQLRPSILGLEVGQVVDDSGRTWSWRRTGGRLAVWRLSLGTRELLGWHAQGEKAVLRTASEGIEIEWAERSAGVLRSSPPPWQSPAAGEGGGCRDGQIS